MKILSLKKRQEFVDISNKGVKVAAKGLVLQALKVEDGEDSSLHIGYTATKRVGNAVIRNRIKRRLRSLAAKIMPHSASCDYKYVLIGRVSTIDRGFSDLEKDLKFALHSTGTHKKHNPS